MYIPFFACNAFVLQILTVCCNDSCARKFSTLGECDETMAIFSLFSLFLWCFVIVLIVMGIEDQCLGQFLVKVDLTNLFMATKHVTGRLTFTLVTLMRKANTSLPKQPPN